MAKIQRFMSLRTLFSRLVNAKPSMYSGSVVLNALGMQWYRIFFFYLRRVARFPKPIPSRYAGILTALERDGVVAIPNFFSDHDYARLKQEYDALKPQLKRDDSEIPIPHVNRLHIRDQKVSSFLRNLFLQSDTLKTISQAFLNRRINLPLDARITRIYCNQDEVHLPANGGTNNLHIDAPLRVLKAFYYVTDTDENNAALYYCQGSQKRNTLKRLMFEYRLSVRYALNRGNAGHGGEYSDDEPWVKITPEEMREHGLQETPMAVRENTLVLVNTGGFHRRGRFLKAGERNTIEINFRAIESLKNALYPFKKFL